MPEPTALPAIHLLDAAARLKAETAAESREIADQAAAGAAQDLSLGGVDVVICDYPGLALHETGVGGYCPGAHVVFVAIEPSRFADTWRQALRGTVVHELHHAKRWQGPGYGATLLDSLVSEGLATLYEIESTGVVPAYAQIDEDLEELWQRASGLLEQTTLHPQWFFGGDSVPRWAGYALGTELARRYCSAHSLSAGQAVAHRAQDFVQSWASRPG